MRSEDSAMIPRKARNLGTGRALRTPGPHGGGSLRLVHRRRHWASSTGSAAIVMRHNLMNLVMLTGCLGVGAAVATIRKSILLRKAIAARVGGRSSRGKDRPTRFADRAGQSPIVPRDARSRLGAMQAGRPLRRAADRSRPVQAGQRYARPRGGQRVLCAVADRLRDLIPPGSMAARLGGDEFVALVPYARGSRRSRGPGAADHCGGERARSVESRAGRSGFDDRGRLRDAGGPRSRRPAARRGRRDVSGQARRARNVSFLPHGNGHRSEGARAARIRSPRGDHARRDQAFLSADRLPAGAGSRRLRGARALGQSGARLSAAGRLHSGGRRDRNDRRPLERNPAPGLPRRAKLAAASAAGGQHIARRSCAIRDCPPCFWPSLTETGFPPGRLEVEITETALHQRPRCGARRARVAAEFGVKIALDDFGAGYSSLQHLRELRFNKIKIDKSYVANLEQGSERAKLVDAIIQIGASLSLQTTAEGIESDASLDWLSDQGCDFAQGYLFGSAMSKDEADKFIQFGKAAPSSPEARAA